MTDKIEEKLQRAEQSRQLLDNPMIIQFFDDLNDGILNAKRNADLENDSLQRKLDLLLQVADKFKRIFEHHIMTGKIASSQLKDKTLFNRQGI